MNEPTLRRFASLVMLAGLCGAAAAAAAAPSASASASASAWTGDARSAVRLVGGTPGPGTPFLAASAINLGFQ